jgi:hypothetical protein
MSSKANLICRTGGEKAMRKTSIWLLLVVASVSICKSQSITHAPTLEVCNADANLWDNQGDFQAYKDNRVKILTAGRDETPLGKISTDELVERAREMGDCYGETNGGSIYFIVRDFYLAVIGDRYEDFIVRHHLFEQFSREDREGKR